MGVPEKSDWQQVNGDKNQVFGAVEGSNVFGDVGGNVTIEAAKRVTSPFQLPRNVADFTGRVDELALIEAALTAADGMGAIAISAVAGMAGVGKSALANCAAHRLVGHFPDAQLYVNLQGADARPRDPGDVLGEWLRALGMDGAEIPVDLHERQKCYCSLLANQRALVLLDNAHDEAQVRPLLPGGAGCGVIVTSRKVLAALPGIKNLTLKTLPPLDALVLLAKIAGESRVAAERAAAEEIVRLCGYLPLAVEIAGGLLKGRADWSLAADYLPKLRDERGRLDALRQEQGNDVRAIFNLSYGQLGEAEQRLFALLGALPGEFGDGVAVAVSELSDEATAAGLDRLIVAQLVEALGERRYRYHDLMRLYARGWLEPDDGFAAAERAFEWYVKVAELFSNVFDLETCYEADSVIDNEAPDEATKTFFLQEALEWFEVERANLLTAFDWSFSQNKHEEIFVFAASLSVFFNAYSYWQDWEYVEWHSLVNALECGNKKEESRALNSLGIVYRLMGHWDKAIISHQQCLEIYRSLDDKHGEGSALNNLGNVYELQNRYDDAIAAFEKSLKIFRSLGDFHNEGMILNNLGSIYRLQNRLDDAITQHMQSLKILRGLGDLSRQGQALNNLGSDYSSKNLWNEAVSCYKQSLEIKHSLGDLHGEGKVLGNLSIVYYSQGRWDEAIDLLEKGLEIFCSLSDFHGESKALGALGQVYQSQGLWDEAIAQYEQSLDIYRSLNDRSGEGSALRGLGDAYLSQGLWDEAITQYEQSLRIFRNLGDLGGEGTTLNNLGLVYKSQGRWKESIVLYEQSLDICCSLNDYHGASQTLQNLGNIYQSQGRWNEAIMQYMKSLEIKTSLGNIDGTIRTVMSLGDVFMNLGDICRSQGNLDEVVQDHLDEAITLYEGCLELFPSLSDRHGEGVILMNLGYLYSVRAQYEKAIEYWQAAQTKLHPDSPEAKQIAQQLKKTYPIRQMLTGGLIWLVVLIFIGFNLLRGHWAIAALTLLAFASLTTYRLWKLRRGNR